MSILFSRRPWLVAVSLLALALTTNAAAQAPPTVVDIQLSDVPTGTQMLEFAGAATTYTITVVPSNTNLNARAQVNAVVDVDIAATGTAGEWTLIVTPPTFDTTALTDTVTITATDPADFSNRVTETIDFVITLTVRDAAVISGLDGLTFAPDTSAAFTFGEGARTFDFTVSPVSVPVSISSATSTLFETWEIVNKGSGTYTLTVEPSGTDPAVGYYSETLTITATEDGRTPATQELIFTITPPANSIAITNFAPDTSAFEFGDGARTFTFDVVDSSATELAAATFTVTSDNSLFAVTETDDDGANKAFTIAPPDTDPGTGVYSATVTITVSSGVLTDATQQLTFTINPPPPPTPTITFIGLADTQTVAFGGTQSASFRVTPSSAQLTYSVSPVTVPPLVVTAGRSFIGARFALFSITAPTTDTGTTTYTITIEATATGYVDASETVTVNLTPAPTVPVVLSGSLITTPTVSLEYAAAATEYTLTANPTTATLDVIRTTGAVRASIEPAPRVPLPDPPDFGFDSTPGEWILTITPPTTGAIPTSTPTDTVTITATAVDHITATHDIAVTVTPRAAATIIDAATGNSLVTGAQPAFEFGDDERTINFKVNPATVPVTISPTTSTVFSTWSLTDNGIAVGGGNSYTLTIQPVAADPGTSTSYSETLTITASEDGRTPTTQELTFTVSTPSVELTGLPATANTPFAFSGVSRTQKFNFAVTPINATFTASVAGTAKNGVTASVSGNTLTVTAPTTDSGVGPYTDTVTVTASSPSHTDATHVLTYTLTPAPIALSGVPIGTQSAAAAQTYTITVVPPTITLAASSGGVVDATIAEAASGTAGEYTLTVTPPATGTTFVDTVTITATDPDSATARTQVTEDIDFTSTRTFAGLDADGITDAFEFGDTARDITFSVIPDTVTVDISPSSSTLFSIWNLANNGGGTYTLTIQPVAIDPLTAASYSETLTVTASEDGRTGVSRELAFTINPSPIELTDLPASTRPFIFDGDTGDALTFNFTVSPATATFTAEATDSTVTATVSGTGADRTLTVRAPATDTGAGPYTDTVTVTASTGFTDVTHDLAITLTPAPIALSGVPTGIQTGLVYGAIGGTTGTVTHTITVSPPTITLAASSLGDGVGATIERTVGGAAGEWTLTVTAPTSGSLLVDTVTITATEPDPDISRTQLNDGIRFSVTPRAAATFSFTGPRTVGTFTFTALVDTAVTETFDFGDDVRTINFSVSPATAQATISPTTSNLFRTWNLASGGAAGSYTLTIQPEATDPGTSTSYSEILTVAAAEDGRETATYPLTFTINPSPVGVTGLPTGTDLTLDYAAAASTFTLTVFPTDATLTATPANNAVTAAVTGSGATRTLTVTPPSTGTTYTDTVTIVAATDPDSARTAFSQTLDFTVTPPASVTLTGTLITDRVATVEYASGATEYTITADPTTATLTATSADSVVGASIATAASGTAGEWTLTLTPPTTGATYTDTVTITATATGRATTTVPITVTVTLRAAATFSGIDTIDTSPFEFGDITFRTGTASGFSVSPASVPVTFSPATSPLFGSWSVQDFNNGNYSLSIQPLRTDPGDLTSYSETLTITATEDGREPATETLTFTINTVPAAPTGVVAVAGNTQLTVSWTAVPVVDNGGTTILTYTATATDTTDSTMTFACTATGAAATTCANPITGLDNGTEYSVAVVATNSAGDSAPSTAAMATPMDLSTATAPTAAPRILSLVAGDAQLTVSWTVVPDANNGGTNIAVYTATATETTNEANTFACIATAPTAAPTCDITGLTNGLTYSVTVVATNGVGDSAPSMAMTATLPTVPAAPTGVTLSAGDQSIEVTWEVVPLANNGGTDIFGYTAIATAPDRADESCTAGAADITCDIIGLANGAVYSVIVIASNSAGDSPGSAPAMATPMAMATAPTAAPTSVMLGVGNTQLTVSWTAVPPANNGGSAILTYTATATNAGNTFTCTATGAAATMCTSPITGLTNGVEYSVIVVATNRVGDSPGSTPVTATPATVPTAALTLSPTTLTLNEGSTTTYTVRLATKPSAMVTVNITGHANTDVTPNPLTLTFTTTDWSTAQTVTLTAAQDADAADEATVTLTHTANGGDYGSVSGAVDVNINDTSPTFSNTITNQIYATGTDIIALTLPEVDDGSGVGTFNYTLAPLPDGLSFNRNLAPPTLTGTPTTVDTHVLTYTVTDSATPTPQTASLTFNVTVVRKTLVITGENMLNIETADTGNIEMGFLTLPTLQAATTVTLSVISQTAVDNQPTGVEFVLTIDIALTDTNGPVVLADSTPATVCLPTTRVPDGRVPLLYHYDNTNTWEKIGDDIATREGFVCGMTTDFSPFAVGWATDDPEELNEQLLSRASMAMTASVSARVAARVEAAAGGSGGINSTGDPSALAYQFGGQSSMGGLLQAHGKAMLEGDMDYERLLDGASFVMPLSAAGDAGGKLGGLSLWGGSDFSNLDGDADDLDWDGGLVSFHLGVDTPVGNNMLAGVALSLNTASFDYTDNGENGDYEYSTTNLHPYFGYIHNEKLNFWGAAGLGQGEIELEADNGKNAIDTSHLSLAGGFSTRLLVSDGLPDTKGLLADATTTLHLKGDVALTQVAVEAAADENFAEQDIDSQRVRLLLSGEQRHELAGGGAAMPSVEVGVRVDGGDGENASGLEVGTGLRYVNPDGNLAVSGKVRSLLSDEYDEWGAELNVRLSPSAGRGLSLSVNPVWGRAQSVAERLWDGGVDEVVGELGGGDGGLQSSLDTEIGYGVSASMLGSAGVLTPYAGMIVGDDEASRVRLGGRFAGGDGLSLNLEGTQKNTTDGASHTVLLRGEVAF